MIGARSVYLLAVATAALSAVEAADYTVTVTSPSSPLLSSWDGWGTSLCWWANVFGTRTDIADLLFTLNDSVSLAADTGTASLPALGFNIARYNIGGSGTNVINDSGTEKSMKASSKMPDFKLIELFWLDWFDTDPTSSSWNWSADAKQRAMVTLAAARGADKLEAFSNSPPWWMTNNQATAGGASGSADNLQSWNHEQFARYLAEVVSHFKSSWGITFSSVEPFNEPSSTWWTYPGTQEGCHFTQSTQQTVIGYLRDQLDTRGLQSVAVAASDENSPTLALSTLQTLSSSSVLSSIGRINTHGYSGTSPYRGTDRPGLKTLANSLSKPLWDSEYGENDATGLSLAQSIALDINSMGVAAFVYWQALDSGGWGLVQSNPGDNWIGTANPKLYVLAQFSRHIRPGMSILSSSDTTNSVVAFNASKKVLAVVTTNTGSSAETVTFNLSAFTTASGAVTCWTTETSGSGALYTKSTSCATVTSKSLSVSIPAAAVVTIEVQNVAI